MGKNQRKAGLFVNFLLRFIKARIYSALNGDNKVCDYYVKTLWGHSYLVKVVEKYEDSPKFWN